MHNEERVNNMIGPGGVNTAHLAIVLPGGLCSFWRIPNESLF